MNTVRCNMTLRAKLLSADTFQKFIVPILKLVYGNGAPRGAVFIGTIQNSAMVAPDPRNPGTLP